MHRSIPNKHQQTKNENSSLNRTRVSYVVEGDDAGLRAVLPILLKHNVSFDIFHDALLQSVLAQMQSDWSADTLDFITIDVATARLRMICNVLMRHRLKLENDDRTVLIGHCSEDTHTLGPSVVRTFFLEAGWCVDGGPYLTPQSGLFEMVAMFDYDLLALSSGHEDKETVAIVIERLRSVSANSELVICLGGPSVSDSLTTYDKMGADFTVLSVADAVATSRRFLAAH